MAAKTRSRNARKTSPRNKTKQKSVSKRSPSPRKKTTSKTTPKKNVKVRGPMDKIDKIKYKEKTKVAHVPSRYGFFLKSLKSIIGEKTKIKDFVTKVKKEKLWKKKGKSSDSEINLKHNRGTGKHNWTITITASEKDKKAYEKRLKKISNKLTLNNVVAEYNSHMKTYCEEVTKAKEERANAKAEFHKGKVTGYNMYVRAKGVKKGGWKKTAKSKYIAEAEKENKLIEKHNKKYALRQYKTHYSVKYRHFSKKGQIDMAKKVLNKISKRDLKKLCNRHGCNVSDDKEQMIKSLENKLNDDKIRKNICTPFRRFKTIENKKTKFIERVIPMTRSQMKTSKYEIHTYITSNTYIKGKDEKNAPETRVSKCSFKDFQFWKANKKIQFRDKVKEEKRRKAKAAKKKKKAPKKKKKAPKKKKKAPKKKKKKAAKTNAQRTEDCKNKGKVFNPKTKRCRERKKAGRKKKAAKTNAQRTEDCKNKGKVFNPQTKRCRERKKAGRKKTNTPKKRKATAVKAGRKKTNTPKKRKATAVKAGTKTTNKSKKKATQTPENNEGPAKRTRSNGSPYTRTRSKGKK